MSTPSPPPSTVIYRNLSDFRGETLSISPYLNTSDGDDMLEGFEESLSPPNSLHPRSPSGNGKRYRTHLTPLQVYVSTPSPSSFPFSSSSSHQVMKCVFSDYKTPSMSECETLGREVGLHKRVVQVRYSFIEVDYGMDGIDCRCGSRMLVRKRERLEEEMERQIQLALFPLLVTSVVLNIIRD